MLLLLLLLLLHHHTRYCCGYGTKWHCRRGIEDDRSANDESFACARTASVRALTAGREKDGALHLFCLGLSCLIRTQQTPPM